MAKRVADRAADRDGGGGEDGVDDFDEEEPLPRKIGDFYLQLREEDLHEMGEFAEKVKRAVWCAREKKDKSYLEELGFSTITEGLEVRMCAEYAVIDPDLRKICVFACATIQEKFLPGIDVVHTLPGAGLQAAREEGTHAMPWSHPYFVTKLPYILSKSFVLTPPAHMILLGLLKDLIVFAVGKLPQWKTARSQNCPLMFSKETMQKFKVCVILSSYLTSSCIPCWPAWGSDLVPQKQAWFYPTMATCRLSGTLWSIPMERAGQ